MNKFYLEIYRDGILCSVKRYDSEHLTRDLFKRMVNAVRRCAPIGEKSELYGVVTWHYSSIDRIYKVASMRISSYYSSITNYQLTGIYVNKQFIRHIEKEVK